MAILARDLANPIIKLAVFKMDRETKLFVFSIFGSAWCVFLLAAIISIARGSLVLDTAALGNGMQVLVVLITVFGSALAGVAVHSHGQNNPSSNQASGVSAPPGAPSP